MHEPDKPVIGEKNMSCWNKEELENMLEDVVNELDLSELAIEKHGQNGTAPAELVRLVLAEKDLRIKALKSGMVVIDPAVKQLVCPRCKSEFVRVDSNREMQMSEINCSDCGLGFQAPVPEVVIEKMWSCINQEDCPYDGYEELAE